MTGTATRVAHMAGWQGRAILYRCDPPLDGSEFVVVSTVGQPPKTAILPANITPVVVEGRTMTIDWGAHDTTCAADHVTALQARGYTIEGDAA